MNMVKKVKGAGRPRIAAKLLHNCVITMRCTKAQKRAWVLVGGRMWLRAELDAVVKV